MTETKIGTVTHYYNHLHVAGVAITGFMPVRLEWPEESRYSLKEVGFYFRAPLDDLPDLIFPLEPIAPPKPAIEGNTAYFTFVWLDGHPRHQKPLRFRLEVFAVNHGLQIGASTHVDVDN